MWIIFKIIVAIIAFGIRFFNKYLQRNSFNANTVQIDGVECAVTPLRNKNSTFGTVLSIDFDCRSVFKLSRETAFDRWCKSVGFAKEIQSGDRSFDDSVYIACDSNAFANEITQDPITRSTVLELLADGAEYIYCNGRILLIRFSGDRTQESSLQTKAVALYKQLSDMERNWRGIFADKFILKAIAVEALIWSIAAYAFGSLFEYFVNKTDLYVDKYSIIAPGLTAGIGIICVLLLLITFFLSGSSRGHRLLVETVLVLGISTPIFGLALYSDININLDKSESVWIEKTIYDKQKIKRRSKNRTYYTYHLYITGPLKYDEIPVPGHIQISPEDFERAVPGEKVNIEIGRGRLNLAWYRSFQFR